MNSIIILPPVSYDHMHINFCRGLLHHVTDVHENDVNFKRKYVHMSYDKQNLVLRH